jgi:uncharacterized protein (UPF0333 family)
LKNNYFLGVLLKGQARIDEFAIILLAGILLIIILAYVWAPSEKIPPELEPTSKTLTLAKDATSTFNLKIIGDLSNVTVSTSGEISGWISFNKNDFDVINSTSVKVTVRVPETISLGTYTGRIKVSSDEGEESMKLTVDVVEAAELASSTFRLGSFSVRYTEASEVLDSKEDLKISKGSFSGKSASLGGIISEAKSQFVTGGSLHLIIEESNELGNLIILLNNEEIFDKKVDSGDLIIPIDSSQIEESNLIELKASSPGWRFWETTKYEIGLAKFTVDFEGILPKEFTFTLEEEEADNFDHLHLSFRLKDHSTPLPDLLISLNDQMLSFKQPPLFLFNETFEKDMVGSPIYLAEDNIISFSIEEEGHYEMANGILVIYYGA